ncbi:MAG: TetR/AcrR family transcriptional regulator [Gemmobacter sp.]
MRKPRPTSRDRILRAATEIAREQGAGHISLDAVAARAGLSKGGLLYNFPTKAALMEALVEVFVTEAAESLERIEGGYRDEPNRLALAFLDAFRKNCRPRTGSGVLAAIAEDPGFVDPARRFQRALVARLKAESADPDLALTAFLCIEGLRGMELLDMDSLGAEDTARVLDRLAALLREPERA